MAEKYSCPRRRVDAIQFQERTALGNVARQFQTSGDLLNWTNTASSAVHTLQSVGGNSNYRALFPFQLALQFFCIQYSVTN